MIVLVTKASGSYGEETGLDQDPPGALKKTSRPRPLSLSLALSVNRSSRPSTSRYWSIYLS